MWLQQTTASDVGDIGQATTSRCASDFDVCDACPCGVDKTLVCRRGTTPIPTTVQTGGIAVENMPVALVAPVGRVGMRRKLRCCQGVAFETAPRTEDRGIRAKVC